MDRRDPISKYGFPILGLVGDPDGGGGGGGAEDADQVDGQRRNLREIKVP